MLRSFCLFLISFFILLCNSSKAQESSIERIKGQPAPEAYDLLKDSKGYLWVAHDLGVSRYDGSAFMNLSNPNQNSFAMTDLVEDKKGRIWCHNFTGQIFYIDKLKLYLLSDYKYKEENGFPRMIICGDELIATSDKGLFVYNTLSGHSKYYTIPGGTRSLVELGNKVVCYGRLGWYCYQAGQPIRKLSTNFLFDLREDPKLQPVSYKDTFYLTVNPISKYYKLTLDGNAIKVNAEIKTSAFLNTISVDGKKVWIHTKNNSFTTDGKEVIDDMNLSDVITDNTGSRWMSSLKKGLCVQYNTQQVKKVDMSGLSAGDYVRRIHTEKDRVFLTTANGKLYTLNEQYILTYVLSIPKLAGIIEHITAIAPNQYLLSASIGLYIYNNITHQLKQVDPSYNIKDIAVHKGKLYAATSIGVRYSRLEHLSEKPYPFDRGGLFYKEDRCRSITFAGDSLVVAYSDGLYIAYNDTIRPLLYKQYPIYASKVRTFGGKVLVGTYNQGLLIIENGIVRPLTEKDGLASNNIKDIKVAGGQVWLMYYDYFQQLNNDLSGIESNAFYFPKVAGINDFGVWQDKLYVAADEGVYSVGQMANKLNTGIASYIDDVTANGQSLLGVLRLAHFQNHLQFAVSTPYYVPNAKISYRYRIKSSVDSTWQVGAPGQSSFDVVALEPGNYTFEIEATDKSNRTFSRPAVYRFEIVPPWYQTWTFRGLVTIAVVSLIFLMFRYYYKVRLRKQRMEYEKILAVQAERQRISSEIHDDIGAGLSALRLLTEITKDKLPESEAQREVGKIHTSISELSQKMREVIWSLNADNDRLESLLYYIQRQAHLLFENSSIRLKVSFPAQDIPEIVIKGDKRRHIYLAVKEALHNCLKHSNATTCLLSMRLEGRILQITITDDGKGFAPIDKWQTGNGLTGMKKRMQQIKGYFEIQSKDKTEVRFIIPIKETT